MNTRSASMDDLREKNAQLETEMLRLTREVNEMGKRKAEASRRQEEGARKSEERLAALVTNQVKQANRGVEGKITNMAVLVKKAMKLKNDREKELEGAQASGVIHLGETADTKGNDDTISLNEEEYEWFRENTKLRGRGMNRTKNQRGGHQPHLPRIDFPHFDGKILLTGRWIVNITSRCIK